MNKSIIENKTYNNYHINSKSTIYTNKTSENDDEENGNEDDEEVEDVEKAINQSHKNIKSNLSNKSAAIVSQSKCCLIS